jgi:glutamate carboxypeptidase
VEFIDRPLAVTEDELTALRSAVAADERTFLADLERLVNIDCGSYTKAGVDEAGTWVASFLDSLGAETVRVADATYSDTIVGRLRGLPSGGSVLLIGHLDTVFEQGTAAARPFRTDSGRAYGPGVTDMKAGLLAGLYALRALRSVAYRADSGHSAWLPFQRLVFVANPDEEVGSPVSTNVIREHARHADAAFVLECARANGDIVSSRKGVVDLTMAIGGRAAHAGLEPDNGRNAILEAAHKTMALHALNGRWDGVTLNVGVISGGTRPNVVAAEARLRIDLRAPTREAMLAVEAELRSICARSTVRDVTCRIEQQGRHWPMEKLPGSARLAEHAVALAARLGFPLRDAATGGASDANTTAGMGIPTLDGLGPIGGNAHSPAEYLDLGSIVPRTTLLAALLLAVSRDGELRGRPR